MPKGGRYKRQTDSARLARVGQALEDESAMIEISNIILKPNEWVPVPEKPLSGRYKVCIQNVSGENILITATPKTNMGMTLRNNSERIYLVSDKINLYAKAFSSCWVEVEEHKK